MVNFTWLCSNIQREHFVDLFIEIHRESQAVLDTIERPNAFDTRFENPLFCWKTMPFRYHFCDSRKQIVTENLGILSPTLDWLGSWQDVYKMSVHAYSYWTCRSMCNWLTTSLCRFFEGSRPWSSRHHWNFCLLMHSILQRRRTNCKVPSIILN